MAAAKAPIEVEVKYDKTTQLALAKKSAPLALQLTDAKITDQETLDYANELVQVGEQWLAEVDAIMDPVREATHTAWKTAVAAQNEFKAPILGPLQRLRSAVFSYLAEKKREADQRQLEADAEQRKKNQEAARVAAAAAKKAGADKEAIAEIKQQVLSTPAPIIQSEVQAPAGVSLRALYSAEITNMAAFLRGAIGDKTLMKILASSVKVKDAIESELRPLAIAQKEAFRYPGTKLVKKDSGARR